MKLKLTDNLFLKILSVLTAIILWLIVVIISDAETTTSYNNMEVTLKNTDVVTENGKVFWVEDGSNVVKLTVRARRSVFEDLKASDFVLTADMEKDLKYDSLVGISIECKNKNIIVDEDVTLSRSNVKVSIEDSATEQFPVQVRKTGEENDGLVVGSMVPEQTVIKVTGPVSIVEKIKKVEAVVDVTGLPSTAVKTCSLKLYDGADDLIDTTYLNYVGKSDGIDVTVSMLNTKMVPLLFAYSGTPAENYKVKGIEWKPEFIEVAGNSDVLAALTSLRIPAEEVYVEGIDEELQLIVDITPHLPSGVIITEATSPSVLVIVEVEYIEPVEEEETEEDTDSSPEKPSNDKEDNNVDKEDSSTNNSTSEDQEGTGSTTNNSNVKDDTSTGTDSETNQKNQEKESGKSDKTENNG